MSSVEHLREFINERLTAAAKEIFTEFEKTIDLLETNWKPEKSSELAELPQEQEVLMDQQEPEPPVKLWTRQEMKGSSLMVSSRCPRTSGVPESSRVRFQEATGGQCGQVQKNFHTTERVCIGPPVPDSRSALMVYLEEPSPVLAPSLCRLDLSEDPPHRPISKEEPDLTDQQLCGRDRMSSLDLKLRVLQQEVCGGVAEEQLVLKEESDIFIVTVPSEESEGSGSEPTSTQLFPASPLKEEPCSDVEELKPCVCSTCGKILFDLSLLNFHQKTHEVERPYSCQTCLKGFCRRDSLMRHMITHTGERPYACQICEDRFGLNSHLLRHMRTHTGEKPFPCNICHKSFSQSNSLTDHMRIHTGEKPYCCGVCGKRFVQRGALTVHTRTHTGEKPYSCNLCGKSFRSSTSLLHHIRTHTGEKPYSCKMCGKKFSQNSNLMTHMRSFHRPAVPDPQSWGLDPTLRRGDPDPERV